MIHFWMVVLVTFELGYLTPPGNLNHLLTRQVVGNVEIEQRQVTVSTTDMNDMCCPY